MSRTAEALANRTDQPSPYNSHYAGLPTPTAQPTPTYSATQTTANCAEVIIMGSSYRSLASGIFLASPQGLLLSDPLFPLLPANPGRLGRSA